VPVRETAAQALGAALQPTSLLTLRRVLELLASMHKHHEWSVRHGAFTGEVLWRERCSYVCTGQQLPRALQPQGSSAVQPSGCSGRDSCMAAEQQQCPCMAVVLPLQQRALATAVELYLTQRQTDA
jgi:hypothetical protein